ncbi:MAG: HpcH/HpaI aldolase/citrate lyase family protein [Christensenellales bacterium]
MDIKQKILSGHKVYGTMLRLVRNPAICLLAKQADLDFLMFDCEYPNYSIETLHDLCLMANAAGVAPLLRASMLSKDWVSRSLDCGACGVMVPMMESAEMAAEFVRWSKYPPLGERGFAAGGAVNHYRRGLDHVALMRQGNDSVLAIAQIETARAIDKVDDIARTPGIDVLLIGPNDLSISLGVPGDVMGKTVTDAIDRVVLACRESGKAFGIHAGQKLLERYSEQLQLVMMNNDIELLSAGLDNLAANMRKIVPDRA